MIYLLHGRIFLKLICIFSALKVAQQYFDEQLITLKEVFWSGVGNNKMPRISDVAWKNYMEIQKKRKTRIRNICHKYNLTRETSRTENLPLVTDVDGKFIYCQNHKVTISLPVKSS